MELELKHLAPYLPYSLKLQFVIRDEVVNTGVITRIAHDEGLTHPTKISIGYNDSEHIWMFKPILRPLSDFNSISNELDLSTDFDNAYYTGADDVAFVNTSDKTYLTDVLTVNEFMFANHFDVFGLIPAGLAIDINILSPKQ